MSKARALRRMIAPRRPVGQLALGCFFVAFALGLTLGRALTVVATLLLLPQG